MRIARIKTAEGARHAVERDGRWHHIVNPFEEPFQYTGGTTADSEAAFLAPVEPKVVLGIGHNGTVNAEGELAVVIGRTAANLTAENALEHVFGYTCVNDVTNVDQNLVDERNFQGKSGVNYTPLGPWIETGLADPEQVAIDVYVNGTAKATSGTFNLPSTVVDCLIYVTSWLTLEAGDVVMTGAPATVVPIEPGDRVDIVVEGIGTLSSAVG